MRPQQTTDDGSGFLKRRRQRIQASGIRAIGPAVIRPEPARPDGVARIRRSRAETAAEREHRDTVTQELKDIDRHAAWIEEQLAALGPASGSGRVSYEVQELRSELSQLGALRTEVGADMAAAPIPDDRTRAIIRMRTKDMSEQDWRAAEQARAEGDHRRARMCRHDALRARQLAERELGIRTTSLRGYA